MDKQKEPLCYAPFTSFLVDTNKGVRPCCAWQDDYFGNLEKNSLTEILNGPAWKNVQRQMMEGEWPKGCLGCKKIESYSGTSVRCGFTETAKKYLPDGKLDLIEVEINSTNQCNLACIHCSSRFSSSWIRFEAMLEKEKFGIRSENTEPHYQENEQLLLDNIRQIDFRAVRLIRFKGGEPFLNKEVKPLLFYLKDKGYLKHLQVEFFTNGTVIDKDYLEILKECRQLFITISVDGTGDLQEYIRYGKSAISRIELFIKTFSILPNVYFSPLISIMVYNVFQLKDIAAWWQTIHSTYPNKTLKTPRFDSFVVFPEYLSVNVLSDKTREDLLQKYEMTGDGIYEPVLQALKIPWAGADWHRKFVQFTKLMDDYRKTDVKALVPELEKELIIE